MEPCKYLLASAGIPWRACRFPRHHVFCVNRMNFITRTKHMHSDVGFKMFAHSDARFAPVLPRLTRHAECDLQGKALVPNLGLFKSCKRHAA